MASTRRHIDRETDRILEYFRRNNTHCHSSRKLLVQNQYPYCLNPFLINLA